MFAFDEDVVEVVGDVALLKFLALDIGGAVGDDAERIVFFEGFEDFDGFGEEFEGGLAFDVVGVGEAVGEFFVEDVESFEGAAHEFDAGHFARFAVFFVPVGFANGFDKFAECG